MTTIPNDTVIDKLLESEEPGGNMNYSTTIRSSQVMQFFSDHSFLIIMTSCVIVVAINMLLEYRKQ